MNIARHIRQTPYICTSCTRRIASASALNGHSHGLTQASCGYIGVPLAARNRTTSPISIGAQHVYSTATTSRGRLRIAIVGSGPAGFYVGHRLINKVQDAVIDMYEQLPVPYGLVRFGVAPDHPEVKNCQDTFEEVAQSPRFNYVGNVRVGTDVELSQMKPHYDAILFSYGASEDRKLGIPGENAPGVYSAREFVGWYNGLPEFQGLQPNLKAGEQAVVVGQGNVALDVARILLSPIDALAKTDIAEQAIQALSESKVNSVRIVGRRGPLQVAFTAKEARELMHIPSVAFEPIDRSFYPAEIKRLPRVQKRIGEVLLKGSDSKLQNTQRSWALEFLKAPKAMNSMSDHLSSIAFTKQQFAPEVDPLDSSARVIPTDETTTIEASLAFRSVGYKSTALPGLADIGVPFDHKMGIIPNDIYGRIISPSLGPGKLTAGHVHGLYCAGWVKRGPTGVIASTMQDAFTSADVIAHDWQTDAPFLNSENGEQKGTGLGWEGVKEFVLQKGVRPLAWADWKKIDEAERARGKSKGKEREKFASVEEMLKVLDA
ncbi:NADPH:adrenodoxin oxidoreductase mitochondrial precursor [Plenodomus tracheiphilus IPT5]|uniref:NADPH:adrenodoxin oxidoreductase, mitochondrial n=1 Tax=Plenodomus tracheiphilus IPT5 TaxID=1408161 RepID=A0A6A7B2L6_9PLEO|nr:NADPH:adrenodoxin oxidoreductase mitochondrial precursor [Plenodomus tracheiphilus IPT5]